jgi:thioredoxin 1
LHVSATLTGSRVHAEHGVDAEELEPGVPADRQAHRHLVDFELLNLDIYALYGVSDRWGLDLHLPIRTNIVHAEFEDAAGNRLPEFSSIHHRDEVLFGPGDLALSARGVIVAGPPFRVDATLGVRVPTGGIEPDPFALARDGTLHQHMFFGTGTFDPVASVNATWSLPYVTPAAWANASVPLYDNRYGYQGSTRVGGGVGASVRLGDFSIQGSLDVLHESPARWDGAAARNSGRSDVLVGAGATYAVGDWQVVTSLKVPAYSHVLDGKLDIPFALGLGVAGSWSFDDAHDHTRELDLATGGDSFVEHEAVALGKITVIDFWATWCAPCTVIGEMLHELSHEYEDLVIRRVEVPTFDTAIAKEHLSDVVGLPVLWIYDRTGTRAHTLVGTDADAVQAVLVPMLQP